MRTVRSDTRDSRPNLRPSREYTDALHRHRNSTAVSGEQRFPSPGNKVAERTGQSMSRAKDAGTEDYLGFQAFYEAHYHAVVGLGYVLGGNRGFAEDMAQEAFVEAYRLWDDISRYDNPGAWVRRVMINRSRSKMRRVLSETKAIARLEGRATRHSGLPERSEEVWVAVRRLPTRQGHAIALRYWDDLGIEQIAEIMDCGTETVKTHLKRGRAALADQLGAEYTPDVELEHQVSLRPAGSRVKGGWQ